MAPQQPGYQIGNRFYAVPDSFKLGDPILVQEITGLDWEQFVDRLPGDDEAELMWLDPVLRAAMIAVAVSRGNPHWRRDKVVRYVIDLDMDAVEPVGDNSDDDAPDNADEGEGRPPAEPSQPKTEKAGATK